MDDVTFKLFRAFALKSGEYKSCTNKVKYSSEEAAQEACNRIIMPMQAYPCPFCNEWHIGKYKTTEFIINYLYRNK